MLPYSSSARIGFRCAFQSRKVLTFRELHHSGSVVVQPGAGLIRDVRLGTKWLVVRCLGGSMGTFRALSVKWAAFAAVMLGATAVAVGPAIAQGGSGSLQQSSQDPAPMMGTPFVGSELRLARTGTGGVTYCPDENQDPRFV